MFGRTLTIGLSGALLVSCGSSDGQQTEHRQAIADPPGAAEALSLGAQAQSEPAGSYQGAVNCAVALQLTSQALRTMSTGTESRELRAIAEAAESFRARALRDGVSQRQLAADFQRGMQENAGNSAGQAQLAIACLRGRDSEG